MSKGANRKNCLLVTSHWSPITFYFLLFTVYWLLVTGLSACGRRGDPIAITPDKEMLVVNDLKGSLRDDDISLTWSMPEVERSRAKIIKGFVIFRAEVPEGTTLENCECPYGSIDFIVSDNKKTFEYLDKKAVKGATYLYKVITMDKNNRMGKDSNVILVQGIKAEPEKATIPPKSPAGLVAVYTQKSVVLAWDDVHDEKVKSYKIYRSEGKAFVAIGTTVTTAFTDSDIQPSKKYYYKVSAVSDTEGPASKEIIVITEIH